MVVGGAPAEEKESEADRVLRHRIIQFVLLGYDIETSEAMASIGIDHHAVASLIDRGASLDQAARILV